MFIRATIIASLLFVPAIASAEDVPAARLRTAAEKGLTLLVKTSPTFIRKGGCNSCHNQMLPAAAQAFARQRGIPAGETIAQLSSELSEATTERFIEYAQGGGAGVSGLGYELFARALARQPANDRVRAQIYFLKSMQEPEGHWRAGGNRPPITFDDFTATAYVIRALETFAPQVDAADTTRRIGRARAWLANAKAQVTQDRGFKLLGLVWAKADRNAIRDAVRDLQALQRQDGGWSQLPATASDAYATGIALYAMFEAGVPASGRSYQAGLRYLVDTQAPDGTWHVKARALPIQPYFESGYPYEHDQWISSAGAAYATLAISAALQPQQSASR